MNRSMIVWSVLAGLTAFWCVFAMSVGKGALLPGLLGLIAFGCAVNTGVRDQVMSKVMWTFSGSGLRAAVIVIGAMMLWQLVGVELALLMAGDVLAYVEVLAAVSLIAANTRLKPALASARERIGSWLTSVVRPRPTPRAARTVRPARRPAPADDADGRAFALA